MRSPKLTRRAMLTGLCATSAIPVVGLGGDAPTQPSPAPAPPRTPNGQHGLITGPVHAAPGPARPGFGAPDPDPFGRGGFDPLATGLGPSAITIDLPQLRYDGDWNPRPGAMRVLARELRLRTRLEPALEPGVVTSDAAELFATPFLYVAGQGELPPLGDPAEDALRRFIDLGGLILFDAADGGTDPAFVRGVKALLGRIAPASEIAPVGRDHVLYRSFYLIDTPMGRTRTHDHVLGVQDEGRLRALIMRNDLGGSLAETADGLPAFPCTPGGNVQREWALRFGVNILLYATCTDYKADRAHVETLLRARRWR